MFCLCERAWRLVPVTWTATAAAASLCQNLAVKFDGGRGRRGLS